MIKMHISKATFLVSLFCIISSNTMASGADTLTKMNTPTAYTKLLQNLDSLSALWYVKQALKLHPEEKTAESPVVIDKTELSDSIYIERLSKIPSIIELAYNKKVKAFINLYANKRRRMVESMLGLSEYYFPIFEEVLDMNEMPHEIKYLPLVESALNPRAVSRAGATGIWQFMYATGKLYDLEINSFVDERRDPVKSTYAAVNFLKDLYDLYGDWTLALVAYNCGPGNVNKAIRRSKGKTDFWDIYYYLPRETRGYIPSFIAVNYLMTYYKSHGLTPKKIDLPIICDTILVKQELHLKQVAEVLTIPLDLLRDLNPQYRADIIPAKTRSYPLKIPANYTIRFIDLEDSIYAYKDSVFFNPKISMVHPPKNVRNRSYNPEPISKNMTALYYTIRSGDNLGFIANWYHLRLSDLRYWNNIRGNMIRAGQKLVVYVNKSDLDKYKDINNMSFAEKQNSVGATVKTKTSKKKPVDTKGSGKFFYYTVRSGDNPWTIAKKYPGVSAQNIIDLNNISDSKKITPGQKLKIPK